MKKIYEIRLRNLQIDTETPENYYRCIVAANNAFEAMEKYKKSEHYTHGREAFWIREMTECFYVA